MMATLSNDFLGLLPCIKEIQGMMEELWGKGFVDRQNTEHHSHSLVRSEAWNRTPQGLVCHYAPFISDVGHSIFGTFALFVLFFENYLYSFRDNSNMLSLSFKHVNSNIVQIITTGAT